MDLCGQLWETTCRSGQLRLLFRRGNLELVFLIDPNILLIWRCPALPFFSSCHSNCDSSPHWFFSLKFLLLYLEDQNLEHKETVYFLLFPNFLRAQCCCPEPINAGISWVRDAGDGYSLPVVLGCCPVNSLVGVF